MATIEPMKLPIYLAALCLLQAASSHAQAGSEPPATSELVRVPFNKDMGLILLDLQVGEGDPLTFVLDSGASGTVIDWSVAEERGLRGRKRYRGETDNRGELDYEVLRSVSFHVGDYGFEQRQVIAAPVRDSASVLIGREVYGILGHTFLTNHVVEVDYELGELVVHDPKQYTYEGKGSALPIEFDASFANLPFTKVSVEWETGEEHAFDALVDSAGSVLGILAISEPSTTKRAIPASAVRVPTLGATGLANTPEGTMHESFATRLHRMHLGPFVIEQPTVGCTPKPSGINLFGAELLRRFHVVFDYRRKRLLLEPNASFNDPKRADCSGMMLVASKDDLSVRKIAFVSPGGPAEEAGIQKNDVILEINGKPAGAQLLHATRRLFFEQGEYRLKIQRKDEVVEKTLHTRQLF